MTMIKRWANFELSEFDCKCGCGFNNIKYAFVDRVQYARNRASLVFIVRSGCRCYQHNKDVGGKPSSDHLTGEGVDIVCVTSSGRFMMYDAFRDAGFTRIGVGPDFIHVGMRQDNPQEVFWIYQ